MTEKPQKKKKPGTARERELYKEAYDKPGLVILPDCLPRLRHLSGPPIRVVEARITASGTVRRPDGSEVFFQDLRVLFTEAAEVQRPEESHERS